MYLKEVLKPSRFSCINLFGGFVGVIDAPDPEQRHGDETDQYVKKQPVNELDDQIIDNPFGDLAVVDLPQAGNEKA